jgi:Peptidase family S41
MKTPGLLLLLAILPLAAARAAAPADPDFSEIAGLLHTNLPGLSAADLNRAEVQGLLAQLHGKAALVGAGLETNVPAPGELSRSSLLAEDTVYLRIARIGAGLSGQVAAACQQLTATNRPKGVVVDLRFAQGADYPAAAAVAGLFLAKSLPLFRLGGETVSSTDNKNAIRLPVAVLVNGDTRGAAEVLAGVLRETRAALVLGAPTAGSAAVMREFPLKNGQRLQIATTPVQFPDGREFPSDGLKPDIAVKVSPAAEKAYFADAYGDLAASTNAAPGRTNSPAHRISEADLVKARRAGAELPEEDLEDAVPAAPEPGQPVLRDPALARAVDLVKGLALIRRNSGD